MVAGRILQLRGQRVIAVNIEIMRAFARLREMIASNKELARRLDQPEARIERKPSTHERAIAGIPDVIRELMRPHEPAKKQGMGLVQND